MAGFQNLKDFGQKLKQWPVIAHLLRTHGRYVNRLGNQFAGAITYFSLLSMVPVIMFAFSACGFTLTVLRPDLLVRVETMTMELLQNAPGDLQSQLTDLVGSLLRNWASIGLVGLISSLYSSAGWAGNLKTAVRAQTRLRFTRKEHKKFILLEALVNLLILLGLIIILAVTFTLAASATALTGKIVYWLGLGGVPGINFILRLAGPALSAVAGWVMFVYLFKVLPEYKFPFRCIALGSLIGSAGLFFLQYLTGFLMSAFSGTPAAAIFGPVIALILFFNLFARLNLYVAAWIATSVQPVTADKIHEIDHPLLNARNVSEQVRNRVQASLKENAGTGR